MQIIKNILSMGPILPVITLEKAEDALPLADALAEGGIKTMEVTLRTTAGLEAIALLADQRKQMVVGAGTITIPEGFEKSKKAGAQFVVSPGVTEPLLQAGKQCGLPYLPGVATTSEILLALQYGHDHLKFFPAELIGGVGMLKTFSSLFSTVRFCPTGGVTPHNMHEYLGLPNVVCVGGSWIISAKAIKEKRWAEITRLAKESLAAVKTLPV